MLRHEQNVQVCVDQLSFRSHKKVTDILRAAHPDERSMNRRHNRPRHQPQPWLRRRDSRRRCSANRNGRGARQKDSRRRTDRRRDRLLQVFPEQPHQGRTARAGEGVALLRDDRQERHVAPAGTRRPVHPRRARGPVQPAGKCDVAELRGGGGGVVWTAGKGSGETPQRRNET